MINAPWLLDGPNDIERGDLDDGWLTDITYRLYDICGNALYNLESNEVFGDWVEVQDNDWNKPPANDPPFTDTNPDWTDELSYHDCNGLCHPPVMNWTAEPQCNIDALKVDFTDQEIRFGAPSGSAGSGERVMHDAHTRWQNCGDHVDPLSPVD